MFYKVNIGVHVSCKGIIVLFLMLILQSVYTAAVQAGPVVLKSPNGELEISIATLEGLTLRVEGGQLAYCVSFRGRSVLEWSNLGLILEGSSVLGTAIRIESSQTSNQDETRVLNGVPPKYITIARRCGNEWFIGSITNWDARELDVPLNFFGNGTYNAEIYADGPNAATQP